MLTVSERKTFDFIKKYIKKNNIAPTISEIAKGIEIKSRGVVHRYVQALAASGKLEIIPNKRRNIRLVEETTHKILLTGKIHDGQLLDEAFQQDEFNVTDFLLNENRYALKVVGNTMIEEGIFDGDLVIGEHCVQPQNGQVVIAIIDQKTATIKRLQQNPDGTLTLLPVYSRLLPQVYQKHQIEIRGIFIGILRLDLKSS
ncbi:MAG: repressor LexA [Gammaproteobacteria bacterium]|nr:repressor LexA [Gammaproteobacteria bacterium]